MQMHSFMVSLASCAPTHAHQEGFAVYAQPNPVATAKSCTALSHTLARHPQAQRVSLQHHRLGCVVTTDLDHSTTQKLVFKRWDCADGSFQCRLEHGNLDGGQREKFFFFVRFVPRPGIDNSSFLCHRGGTSRCHKV